MKDIESEYGKSEDVLRLYCKYYIYIKDYEAAKKAADKLINKYRNEENYVIYTDVIAQEAYSKAQLNTDNVMTSGDGINNSPDDRSDYAIDNGTGNDIDNKSVDSEVRKLIEKAERKYEQAKKLEEYNDNITDEIQAQIDKLLSEANDLYTEANYVDVKGQLIIFLQKDLRMVMKQECIICSLPNCI